MSLSQLLHALCFFLDIASYHNAPLLLYRLVFLNEFVFQCQTFRGILSYYCVVHFLPVFILNCVPLPYTVLFSLVRSIHLALTSEHNNQSDLIMLLVNCDSLFIIIKWLYDCIINRVSPHPAVTNSMYQFTFIKTVIYLSVGANNVHIQGALATSGANNIDIQGALVTSGANNVHIQGALVISGANKVHI